MEKIKFNIEDLNIFYGRTRVIRNLTFQIEQNEIFTIIGPANSGKSSFLYTLNRLNDLNSGFKKTGLLSMNQVDIYTGMDVETL
ncbi:MAG: phosphate ABC transporter ATP-binding protein, partial [bacterium]|nr:phosphate ABC transporter ATP-binding protein [bacterium]